MSDLAQRVLRLGFSLALLGAVLSGSAHGLHAQGASPQATPVMPSTPVGEQLAWVLDQLNGGAASLTEADIEARFDPSFLAQFPAPMILQLLQQTAAEQAPIMFADFLAPPTDTAATALIETATGERGALTITVAPEPPHRITRLELGEAPPEATVTGRRVDIGGRSLFLNCTGQGSPTVVLEGGLSSDWAAVQAEVAGITRVCSYDRPDAPGTASDPVAEPRTAQQVVDDLHALLAAAGEAGPYVLVGHSLGGLYVQLYAYQHPVEVAGLVLVDPTPETFASELVALTIATYGTPAATPDATETARSPQVRAEEASYAQMRQARATGTLPPVPLIVLTHGRAPEPATRPAGWPIAEEERIFRVLHAELAALVPSGRHVIVEGSGHDLPKERPEVVVEAIAAVVMGARDPATWSTPAPGTSAPSGRS